jgi:GNAT superfamily N-acetyltransferase
VRAQINPPWLDEADYVAFLNCVFPGQWDRVAYQWYMRRAFNGVRGDILVRAEGSRILSGMAFCHRQIAIGADEPIDVAVISAAATLPSEQGCGHYTAMLRFVIDHARELGYAAVLGFVTRDNRSGRGLVRTGALAIPSFYIVSAEGSRVGNSPRARSLISKAVAADERKAAVDAALAAFARRQVERGREYSRQAHFHYERTLDWIQQFIDRPHGVRAVRLAHDSLALIETVGATDRLQMLTCPDLKTTRCIAALAAASAVTGKKFFMYTLDPHQAAAALRAGLRIREGRLMVQPTGYSTAAWNALAAASWAVQSGDRL